MRGPIYVYVLIMWALIVAGGGVLVAIIGPLNITGLGKLSEIVDSGVKAAIAMLLVVLWIFIMSKVKNWIFHRQIGA